jgi:type I restriction enzyme M protein
LPNSSDYSSEDDVRFKFVVSYLKKKGYSVDCVDFNKSIKVQEGRKEKTIFADAVVYIDEKKQSSIILVETKSPNEVLGKADMEQAISYARLLPRIAPFALLTNSVQTRVYQVVTKDRIADIPDRKDLSEDIVALVISKEIQASLRQEAIHELFIIDDVKTFRSILRQCHNEIRNNEGYDPTQAFDEMSKILFCKMYEEKNNYRNNRFTLRVFDRTMELGINVVQKIYEDTIQHPKYAGLFPKNDKIKLQDRTIRRIVELFENYDLSLTSFDVKGEAFEYFLSDTFTGGLGEYFTPRNIVEFMVDAINPKIGEKIVDPFCGTGGFLIYAFDVVSEKIRLQDFSDEEKEKWREELSNKSLFGTDWKERTIQACKMNMIVHGDGHTGIFLHHGLTNIPKIIEDGFFVVCLTNPPFGADETDKEILRKYELGKSRKAQEREVLAIERVIRLLKPEGRAGIVVVEGILNTPKYDYVRKFLRQNVWIDGIIGLNYDTFAGYGSKATTSMVFFRKKNKPDDEGQQKDVFMGVCANSGYSSSGLEIPGNELPELLFYFQKFLTDKTAKFDDKRVLVVPSIDLKDRLDPQHYISQISEVKVELHDLITARGKLKQQSQNLNATFDALFGFELMDVNGIKEWDTVEIGTLIKEYKNPEKVGSDKNYVLIGVRGNALGAFVKEPKMGRDIKAKTLFKIKQGALIYNRLFAHRGSFAVLNETSFADCYVSGEFPQFEPKNTKYGSANLIKYLFYYCISPYFVDEVRRHSSGSTKMSRFRLNQNVFLELSMRIPSRPEDLDRIVQKMDNLFAMLNKIKDLQKSLDSAMAELRAKTVGMLPH